jgi:hypothetical protein
MDENEVMNLYANENYYYHCWVNARKRICPKHPQKIKEYKEYNYGIVKDHTLHEFIPMNDGYKSFYKCKHCGEIAFVG